jgi:hypothetical protein
MRAQRQDCRAEPLVGPRVPWEGGSGATGPSAPWQVDTEVAHSCAAIPRCRVGTLAKPRQSLAQAP